MSREGYSTLEVHRNSDPHNAANPPFHPDYSQFPEAVPTGTEQKELIPRSDQAPEAIYTPPPQHYYNNAPPGESTWQSTQSTTVDGYGQSTTGTPQPPTTAQGPRDRRICGLKRRTFFILLAVLLIVIIGAVVGAVAGVLTTRKNNSSSSSSAPLPGTGSSNNGTSSPSNVNIMDISSLAATNWTDGKSFHHRAVFFQDPWNSIIARRWDSQNLTWTTTNITAVMANSPTALDPAPGTALAAASLDWPNAYQMRLHFLDRQDMVRVTYSDAPVLRPDLWKNDTLGGNRLRAAPGGSRLAATWQRCVKSDCVGTWTMAFQGADGGALQVRNYSDWSVAAAALPANRIAGATGMALIPQYRGVQDRLGLVSQSYSSGTQGSFQITGYTTSWESGKTDEVIPSIPLPAGSQQVAATKWAGDWSKTLVYALLGDGTLRAAWRAGGTSDSWKAVPNVRFAGEGRPASTNFTAVAMSLDAMLYGYVGDEIHEYTVDDQDAGLLTWQGKVYP